MPRTQSPATIVKHLRTVLKRAENWDCTSIPEDNALRVAIGIIADVLLMENMNRLQAASKLVGSIARMTKDGECSTCGQDGHEPNHKCTEHESWDMPNDDAYDTLHSLISQARSIIQKGTK
jgi:hypothetical protein